MPFVYLLRCSDDSLYCGWTTDVERRLAAHREGSASRYTRSRRPVELAAVIAVADRSEALREEARQELLESLAAATEEISFALAALGEAYEQLDEHNADRLEEVLFAPVQAAFGRAKSTYSKFAERHSLPTRSFEAASPGLPSTGAKGFIDSAVRAVANADGTLAELQDSGLPAEVGDVELRAALRDVRALLGDVRQNARALERTLGR